MATLKSHLFPGCTSRIIGHLELCINAAQRRPVDPTRSPGYDQHNAADVTKHIARLKALGIDVLMPNTYAIGSPENVSLEVYLPLLEAAGMGLIINIDKGLYAMQPSPIAAIRTYLTYLRTRCFPLKNYEKWNGKYIVTYFVLPTDDPAMFRQIEAENPDVIFVYNDGSKGPNTMAWVEQGLDQAMDYWCRQYANALGLQIPCISPGFNDTLLRNGIPTSVWDPTQPARIWPAGTGPSSNILAAFFKVFNTYYSIAHQAPYLQLVTINDWDELTAIEPKADGTGGYFSPLPVAAPAPAGHGEIWIGGTKQGDYPPGTVITIQKCAANGSVLSKQAVTV